MELHRDVSLGQVSRCVTGADFRVVESTHRPQSTLPLHAHRAVNLTLALRGEFLERWDSVPICCGPGTVLFKRAFQPHSNRYGTDGADVLHLEPVDPHSLAARSLATLFAGPTRLGFRIPESLRAVFSHRGLDRRVRRMLDRMLPDEPGTRTPAWVRRIRWRILERCDIPISLAALAREFDVSRAQLTRSFRTRYGCSIGEYARRSRVERAAELLVSSDLPQVEIAGLCGFSDQAHLCRLFQRRMGQSPGRYRRAYRVGLVAEEARLPRFR